MIRSIISAGVIGFLLLGSSLTAQQQVQSVDDLADGPDSAFSFAGTWKTTFGELELAVDGHNVTGKYDRGTVQGTVDGRVLKFEYREKQDQGEGEFTIAGDGDSFQGRWKAKGSTRWRQWVGQRISSVATTFDGLWETSFGMMRLVQNGDEIAGSYFSAGQESSISGQQKGERFVFRYVEANAEGAGWFELSDDKQSLEGQWRVDSTERWRPWTGERAESEPRKIWLVILEADWESGLAEPEYAFADMLENYFRMSIARHVEVRKRSFHDEKDLVKFCREVKYLPEPVVLLISTHGTNKGITVGRELIGPVTLAKALDGSGNLKALHLSGCSMMSGEFPKQLHAASTRGANFPITGYQTMVAWDASALADFTYLSMLLIHRLEPAEAVRQAKIAAPYLGDEMVKGSLFASLGLTIQEPAKTTRKEPTTEIVEPASAVTR